jgi:IS605 OrfB family transposase
MAPRKKKVADTLQLEKLLSLQALTVRQSGRWLTKHLSFAIEHLPDKEELIFTVFKQCVVTLFLVKKSNLFRSKTLSMLESLPRSNWTTFLDKLNSSEESLNTLTTYVLKILAQELISREKVFRPFWILAYKELSENLLLPIETDCADLDTNLLSHWSSNQEVKSQYLKVTRTKLVNKNLPKICYPSSMCFPADKWERGVMPIGKLKTRKIQIFPTPCQKITLNEFIDTSRYVYNKTLEQIKNGHQPNFYSLRDLLVTEKSKKGHADYSTYKDEIAAIKSLKHCDPTNDEKEEFNKRLKLKYQELRNHMKSFEYVKNLEIKDFELNTPKDVRACAVKRVCDAFKSGFTNLRRGNIRFFNLKYQKKTEPRQSFELTPKNISMQNGKIKLLPNTLKGECFLKMSKKNEKKYKNLHIKNNVDVLREKGKYFIYISIDSKVDSESKDDFDTVAGVDMGLRTFGTVHTNTAKNHETTITEYKHRSDLLKAWNKKLQELKTRTKYYRKKQYNKLEKKKTDMIDSLHWEFINDLLEYNDVVYYGDIKSHDIVKDGKNKTNNQHFNDLKFYILKQRLMYKASLLGKRVFLVPEHYTTKSCSTCGMINNNVGSSEIFCCAHCCLKTGRDVNSAKNMKMKGMFME